MCLELKKLNVCIVVWNLKGVLVNNSIMSDLKKVWDLGDVDFTLKEQEKYFFVCYKLIGILMDDYFFHIKNCIKVEQQLETVEFSLKNLLFVRDTITKYFLENCESKNLKLLFKNKTGEDFLKDVYFKLNIKYGNGI